MKTNEYRMLLLITTPKQADKAAETFLKSNLPIQYRFNARGTASSEIMDTLGLGSIDKTVLLSTVPRSFANAMLRKLHNELRMDTVNSGIAFTVPITGASALLLRMMDQTAEEINGKDEMTMQENHYTLIAAIVNRGYSNEVMDAARAAGAGGGTVLHSRSIGDEKATGFWGLGVQEGKEIVLILAEHGDKMNIMTAIGEKCGMHSEAKGTVFSLPIDAVTGI